MPNDRFRPPPPSLYKGRQGGVGAKGPPAPPAPGAGIHERPRGPLPPKLYFRIGEVAGLVGVEPHVLRYWEREFRSIRPTKSAKGQRVYSRRDVENLLRVRDLLYQEGFTIAGAKKRLQKTGLEPREAEDPAVRTHARVREKLTALRSEIQAFLEELGG